MSDPKRPQLAPEVLDQPSTQSTGSNAATDKELRSYTADTTLVATEQVHQPKPKAVARPIVEVSPNASISPVDAQNAEQVHHPKPKAVARPIVEVSPNASIFPVDMQKAEPVREPFPKPVARPIVEVVAGIPRVDVQNEEAPDAKPSEYKVKK
jgi:hypothetical protein